MNNNKIIRKTKNMNLISYGTEDILSNLSEKDKFFCLSVTSSLSISKPQVVTKKVVENMTSMYDCKTREMLKCINNLIYYFYYNPPIGFKRVPGFEHILCNENDEMIHFLRRYLTIFIDKKGYGRVSLNGSRSYHRLIALTWIPNPENKETINHIDGNKLNNKVNNLEWNTIEENRLHAIRTGLMNTEAMRLLGNGEKNSQAILTTKDVIFIRETFKTEIEKIKTYLCKTYDITLEVLNDILEFKNKKVLPILYTTKTYESKMFPGKIYIRKRKIPGSTESNIRGYFNLNKRKLNKHFVKKFKISNATVNDIISRRSWNYDYC